MGFKANHTVHHNNVVFAEGDAVKFTDDEIAQYQNAEAGPIAELLARNAITPFSPIVDKARVALEEPLEGKTPAQLGKIAKDLGIPKEPKLEGQELLDAITAKRAEIAEQADKAA